MMRVLLIAFALIGASVAPVRAQDGDYPNRQVNFIVPFAPGAGTVTAAVQVARSAPDGYTIMMATSGTMAMNTTLYRKLPYEPGKDLVLVALICHVPFVLVVNPALPVNSVADLVKLAK